MRMQAPKYLLLLPILTSLCTHQNWRYGGELIICYWMVLPGLSPSVVTVGVEIALKYVQLKRLIALHYMHIIINIAL